MEFKDFEFTLQDGTLKRFSDFKDKFIVLYFYPKDDTSGCTLEALEFNSLLDEFKNLNAVVFGISKDSAKSHKSFCDKHSLKLNLISDVDLDIIKYYDVYGKKMMYGREYLGIIRSTILISPKREILKVWRNVKVLGHANEVLETIKEF